VRYIPSAIANTTKAGNFSFAKNNTFESIINKNMPQTKRFLLYFIILFSSMTFIFDGNVFAQNKNLVVRIAKLEIYSAQLEAYKAALKEHAETAVRVEPGVLNLMAVFEKNNPTRVTVFEIYANEEAYKKHLQAPHFLKYKAITKDMVKSLELIETVPITLETKYKNSN
jgi:quinol monooxygenase YgiN